MDIADGSSITNNRLEANVFDRQFFHANPNWLDYVVYTDVRWLETGTGDSHPKFGVYAAYVDKNNWLAAMIDVTSCGAAGCITTGGKSNGALIPWKNCSLPPGFEKSATNALAVEVSHGSFTVLLNGKVLSGACQRMQAPELDLRAGQAHDSNGEAGVVVQNTRAAYTHFHVSPGVPRDNTSSGQAYSFRNRNSHLYLASSCTGTCGSASENPGSVVQFARAASYPDTRDLRQLWKLRDTGEGSFALSSADSSLCLQNSRGGVKPAQSLATATPHKNGNLCRRKTAVIL